MLVLCVVFMAISSSLVTSVTPYMLEWQTLYQLVKYWITASGKHLCIHLV
jgi:hypothetical protein